MSLPYRPEIDGMRTIAVLSVIIYHMKLPIGGGYLLAGGFLGVDIFFVLSGYLIGGILLREAEKNHSISYQDFYVKRARRILPELLLVLVASSIASWFLLLPSELTRYCRSLFSAIGFYSNFFWYFELGEYGAQSGLLQPLLHTWSLSIEEQFYLLFPIVLTVIVKARKQRWIGPIIVAAIGLSFTATLVSTQVKPPLSFFSPISRAWELLAGVGLSRLAITHSSSLNTTRLSHYVTGAALLILFFNLASVDLTSANHPGVSTIPTVAATCALIWFAKPGGWVTEILSIRPMVYIGKLSYSLYLWHFPVFAFGRLKSLENPSLTTIAIWLVVTVALSWIGYTFVGQPLRKPGPWRKFSIFSVALLIPICSYSILSIKHLGFPIRFSQISQRFGGNEIDLERLRDESLQVLADLTPKEKLGAWIAGTRSKHEKFDNWFSEHAQHRVLIIGNSHSKDMFNALYLNRDKFPGIQFARLAFDADMSASMMDEMFNTPNFKASDIILVSPKYRSTSIRSLDTYIPKILAAGKRVILVGNTAEFVSPSPLPIFDWYLWRTEGGLNAKAINELGYRYESGEAKIYTKLVSDLAEKYKLQFYSRRDLICFDNARSCTLVEPTGRRTMYDDSHWTIDGAVHFGHRMSEHGWLKDLN